MCVCPSHNLKTIAVSGFCSVFYVDRRKVRRAACQITGQGQGHFWRVQGHSVRLWAIVSQVVRFHLCFVVVDDLLMPVLYRLHQFSYWFTGTRIDVPTGRTEQANNNLRNTWETTRMRLTGQPWGTINNTIYKQVQCWCCIFIYWCRTVIKLSNNRRLETFNA